MASIHLSNCKIEESLNEECHKFAYCGKKGLLPIFEFKEPDRHLIQWRCGIQLKDENQICLHHEKVYLTHYQSLQKYCSDPFSVHKKHIYSKFYSL